MQISERAMEIFKKSGCWDFPVACLSKAIDEWQSTVEERLATARAPEPPARSIWGESAKRLCPLCCSEIVHWRVDTNNEWKRSSVSRIPIGIVPGLQVMHSQCALGCEITVHATQVEAGRQGQGELAK